MNAPVWYTVARKYIGVKEIPGPKDNPTILGFAARIGGWVKSLVKSEATAWCGAFMGSVMREAFPGIKLPANPLSALAWASWGVSLASPTLGAVLVFKRPGGGHVGLYVGEDATCYHVLGGNQGDAVSVARVEKNRLVPNGIRWVPGIMAVGGRIWLTATGQPSTNEA